MRVACSRFAARVLLRAAILPAISTAADCAASASWCDNARDRRCAIRSDGVSSSASISGAFDATDHQDTIPPTQNFGLFRGLIQCSETFLCDRPHAPALEACHAHGDPNDLPGGQRPRKPLPQNRADTPRQAD